MARTIQLTRVKVLTFGHDVIDQTEFTPGDQEVGEALTLLYDGHGSTRAIVDASAVILQHYAYTAYGIAIGFDEAQALTAILYSGEWLDAKTGWQYLHARWYDPNVARFNRDDPFSGNLNDPQSLHKYLYVHGDPVNGIDPTGRFVVNLSTALTIGLMALNAGSAALNIKAGVEHRVAALNLINEFGDIRGAAIHQAASYFFFGMAIFDVATLFIPPPPPAAGIGIAMRAVVGAGGRRITGRAMREIIIHAPGLAGWIERYMVPAVVRTSIGATGIYLAEGGFGTGIRGGDTRTTEQLRNSPGTATGGHTLPDVKPGETWLQEGVGLIPRQIADKLRGLQFNSLREFRKRFWEEVYEIPHLLEQFNAASKVELEAGRAPWSPVSGQLGNRKKFELDHMETLKIGGEKEVYNLDNLMITTPRTNMSFENYVP